MTTVRTLSPDELVGDARMLLAKIRATEFEPDVVVGIATAGAFVAAAMMEDLDGARLLEVTARRSSHGWKQHPVTKRLVGSSPAPIQRVLRRVEHQTLTRHGSSARQVTMSVTDQATLEAMPRPDVLVVDDAIDTGASMDAAVAFVRDLVPQGSVRTAVLSLSLTGLGTRADAWLYENVALSGPWSLDA